MSRNEQMVADLIEIFDEEYDKRRCITPHNTADKMTAKGYRKASDVAAEIFAEIDDLTIQHARGDLNDKYFYFAIDELRKKYAEG